MARPSRRLLAVALTTATLLLGLGVPPAFLEVDNSEVVTSGGRKRLDENTRHNNRRFKSDHPRCLAYVAELLSQAGG